MSDSETRTLLQHPRAHGRAIPWLKTIGIIGGSSDQATADYYRMFNLIANRKFGGYNTADLLVSSMNFALAENFVRKNLWQEGGDYIAERAINLERGGAQLLICVSNTLHRVADIFAARVKIPFLHIVDPTAAAILGAGFRRVGLLGTKSVMSQDFLKRRYLDRFGIEILVPGEQQQEMVDRTIFDELCRGVFRPETKASYLALADELASHGAQGVVLGCTEIPLLLTQEDRPNLPFFNTAALHVEAALELATPSPQRL